MQVPFNQAYLLARSNDDPQQLVEAMRTKLRELDAGLPLYVQPWTKALDGVLFGSRMATVSLKRARDAWRDAVHHGHFWQGRVLR